MPQGRIAWQGPPTNIHGRAGQTVHELPLTTYTAGTVHAWGEAQAPERPAELTRARFANKVPSLKHCAVPGNFSTATHEVMLLRPELETPQAQADLAWTRRDLLLGLVVGLCGLLQSSQRCLLPSNASRSCCSQALSCQAGSRNAVG